MVNEELKAVVERIERLEAEKKSISEDIAGVYSDAVNNGFDKKALRSIIALRKKDSSTVAEEEAILDTYRVALGMVLDV